MDKTEIQEFDGFFTEEDLESFKECSQVVFKNIGFQEANISTIVGKQNLKAVLSWLFRAGGCPEKNSDSVDNWYSYVEEKDHIRLVCLYDDLERDNAVLKAMQHIKRDTGFQVPYFLLRFDLYYDVMGDAPVLGNMDDGNDGKIEVRALTLSEKYMHFLGMQATSGVDHVMRELKMPKYKVPVVCALITDTVTEYWSYYILVSSVQFDLNDWTYCS